MYEPCPSAERLEASEDEQAMFNWAREQGIQWSKITYPVRFPRGYIGSMAIDEILPGEHIIKAPNSALLTIKSALNSDLKDIFSKCPDNFSNTMLAFITFLISEKFKGPSSNWAAFIKYQSKTPTILQDWLPEELDELQDKDLKIDTEERKMYHEYCWKYWKSILEKYDRFTQDMLTLEEYTWASRVVGTKSFGKFMPSATLFPIGELLNHNNVETFYTYQKEHEKPDWSLRYSGALDYIDHDGDLITSEPMLNLKTELMININQEINKIEKNNEKIEMIRKMCVELDNKEESQAQEHKKYKANGEEVVENDENWMSVVAGPNEHYKPGSEVFISYGRYSNRQLLISYGFALNENHYNNARIKVLLKNLAMTEEQGQVLNNFEAYSVFKLRKFAFAEDFLRVFREVYWKADYCCESFLYAKVPELELLSLSGALKVLKAEMEKFPTNIEEDNNRIIEPGLPIREYFAILYRKQVKEIILAQIRYMEVAMKIIERMRKGKTLDKAAKRVNGENDEGMV